MFGFCPWCIEEKDLTLEHVIPVSLGGALTIYICKECNNLLNRAIEQDATCNPLFAIARLIYRINGRRGIPKNPLAGVGETQNGRKVRLDNEMKPFILPTVDREETDSGTILSLSIDENDRDKVERIARREIVEVLKEKNPSLTDDELECKINEAMQTVEESHYSSTDIVIKRSLSVDLKPISQLAMKIAYEMAYLKYGREYAEKSSVGQELRKKTINGNITGMVGKLNEPNIMEIMSNPKQHNIVIVEDKCIVSLFGFIFVVKVSSPDEHRTSFHDAELFSISVDTGEVFRETLSTEIIRVIMHKHASNTS